MCGADIWKIFEVLSENFQSSVVKFSINLEYACFRNTISKRLFSCGAFCVDLALWSSAIRLPIWYLLLAPRFLEKASGMLLSPPSVCPSVCLSVRLSVMLSPPKPLDRIQPNLMSGLLTQVGRARALLFLAPPPGALGRGQKVKY